MYVSFVCYDLNKNKYMSKNDTNKNEKKKGTKKKKEKKKTVQLENWK